MDFQNIRSHSTLHSTLRLSISDRAMEKLSGTQSLDNLVDYCEFFWPAFHILSRKFIFWNKEIKKGERIQWTRRRRRGDQTNKRNKEEKGQKPEEMKEQRMEKGKSLFQVEILVSILAELILQLPILRV